MKLEEQVKKSILNYPSLYKCADLAQSRLLVLNQIFLVIGNGYKWANTKDPKKGGYLTDDTSYIRKGKNEGERKFDRPYGSEKAPYDYGENYFKNKVFYISGVDYPAKIVRILQKAGGRRVNDVLIEIEGLSEPKKQDKFDFLRKPSLMEAGSYTYYDNDEVKQMSPYPICEYSAIKELFVGDLFIQPDWLQGAIDVAKETLNYYNDEKRYKRDTYYPSPERIKADENTFERRYKEGGKKAVDELRKIWGYQEGQTVKQCKQENWQKFHMESVTFLNKFLKKYN